MPNEDRLVAEIDADLKKRARADPRTIKQVVEEALEREFSTTQTAAVERRIDEKRQRIQTLEREINERKRELAAEQDALDRLERQLDEYCDGREAKLAEAREALARTPKEEDNAAVQRWAEELGMTPQQLLEEL